MATITEHIFRILNDVRQTATVQRDLAVYPRPAQNAQFITKVKQNAFAITLSSGTVIAPVTATTGYVFQGIQVGGYPSTNLGVLNITAEFRNGRVYLIDHATPGGGTPKYLINSNRFVDSVGGGKSFPPGLPILVQKIIVPSGRPEVNWRDNPITNASQCIRIL